FGGQCPLTGIATPSVSPGKRVKRAIHHRKADDDAGGARREDRRIMARGERIDEADERREPDQDGAGGEDAQDRTSMKRARGPQIEAAQELAGGRTEKLNLRYVDVGKRAAEQVDVHVVQR